MVTRGLEGVVAATTRLSQVDGERGELLIAGYPVAELAPQAAFEEVTWLLWNGELPSSAQLAGFDAALRASRAPSPSLMTLLRGCVAAGVGPMDALRIAAGTLTLDGGTPVAIVARTPVIVAACWRLQQGLAPLAARDDLGHAANFLYMLTGDAPDREQTRALDTYLNTVVDHGLNASTFTARVITSTGSDLVSAVVGAIGALKGPLHGGAPGPALDMVFEALGVRSRTSKAADVEIQDLTPAAIANAEAVLRRRLDAGERLMGFGHRVYKVRDPRADVLADAAARLYARAGDVSVYTLAREVEATAIRLLEEYKPGRRLRTNVEFYTALLLHGLGLDAQLFTPTFAIGRVSGWIAHALEQRDANRIIRPQSVYEGPRRRSWVPIGQRP
jgi:citrate synthase